MNFNPSLIVGLASSNPVNPDKMMPTAQDPNNPMHYLNAESVAKLESNFKISTDLSRVKFYLWTPETGSDSPFEFNAETSPQELLNNGFKPERNTKFISHGWNSHGIEFSTPFVKGEYSSKSQIIPCDHIIIILFSDSL